MGVCCGFRDLRQHAKTGLGAAALHSPLRLEGLAKIEQGEYVVTLAPLEPTSDEFLAISIGRMAVSLIEGIQGRGVVATALTICRDVCNAGNPNAVTVICRRRKTAVDDERTGPPHTLRRVLLRFLEHHLSPRRGVRALLAADRHRFADAIRVRMPTGHVAQFVFLEHVSTALLPLPVVWFLDGRIRHSAKLIASIASRSAAKCV